MKQQQDHSHVRYRLDVANEMVRLLRSGDLNIWRQLLWQEELDWHLGQLRSTGHEVTLVEHENRYQFTSEV